MATSKENRSWKAGRKGVRKKTAKPQVAGLFIALGVLGALLIWLIWPRPVVSVRLYVLAAEEGSDHPERGARYATAAVDSAAVHSAFSDLAEQVVSVAAANRLSVSEFKSLRPQEMNIQGGVGILFLNAHSRVSPDHPGPLLFEFGSERDVISYAELVAKFREAGVRELILLVEGAHEFPGFDSGILANEGPGLLQIETERLGEVHPGFSVTVVSSTSPLSSSYPYLIPAKGIAGLDELNADREIIRGTVFGQSVAAVFREGAFQTLPELTQQIASRVEKYVSDTFRGEQKPQVFASLKRPEPVILFPEPTGALALAAPPVQAAGEAETTPAKEPVENAADSKTPVQKLVDYRTDVQELFNGPTRSAISIGDWRQLNALAGDLKYELDHGNLQQFQAFLDEGQRYLVQVRSATDSTQLTSEFREIQEWISPVSFENGDAGLLFNEFLQLVNEGEESRSPQLVERLKSAETRQQLVASFLSSLQIAQEDLGVNSTEATQQRLTQRADWALFFQRLFKKTGWRKAEWPQHFLIAEELLQRTESEWKTSQFAAFLKLQRARAEALQLAAGWSRNGAERLSATTYHEIQGSLQQILISSTAAERWFLLGESAASMRDKRLFEAEKSLAALRQALNQDEEKQQFLVDYRRKIFDAVEPLALQHDAVMLSSEELQTLAGMQLESLSDFPATNFPQASFSQNLSRDDAIALLQLTTYLTPESSQQQLNESESGLNRFRRLVPTAEVGPAAAEFSGASYHQGIWLGFWSIRALQTLSSNVETAELTKAWRALVAAVANSEDSSQIASKRTKLAAELKTQWNRIEQEPLASFESVPVAKVSELISQDLQRHAQLAGTQYSSRVQQLFGFPSSGTKTFRLQAPAEELKVDDGVCRLNFELPTDSQVWFYPAGVRLENSRLRDLDGWQTGTWDQAQQTLKTTADFTGSAQPILAIVDSQGIVQDAQKLNVGVAFQVTGWNVRFLSNNVRLDEVDLPDNLKLLKLPPNTGKAPLPVTVQLLQPENSFAKSVLVNMATLNELGEPGKFLWPQYQELALDPKTRSTVIPLVPPPTAEGVSPVAAPMEGFDFTNGLAIMIRAQNQSAQADDVVLRVTPRYFNPLDHYLQVGDPEFDQERHKLFVPVRRRANIPASAFAEAKIAAELNFSRELDGYSLTPAPKRPEIPESNEILEGAFAPAINDAIRKSESEIGTDRLEFGLSAGGLENVAKWRLGQSLEMERIGYARRGSDSAGNRTEIRIGMNLVNPPDAGVQVHNLDGLMVLGDKWRTAVLDLPLELYGYQAESARASRLELGLRKQGSTDPLTLASLSVRDAYQRKVSLSPKEPGLWLLTIESHPHGKFGVNLFENFGVTEGRHSLHATLKDENSGAVIGAYQADLMIEDTAPSIEWKQENPPEVFTNQNYNGFLSIGDPQTGLASIEVGLSQETMVQIPLKDLKGDKRTLKIPFTIEKSSYPEISAKEVPVSKRMTILANATNRIGMVGQLSKNNIITLTQPAAVMTVDPASITGTLLLQLPKTGVRELVLAGAGGKVERKLPIAKDSARFDDLPQGNYTLTWKGYDGTPKNKSLVLKFEKLGDTFNSSL